ncbi:MAG: hypothetical protein KGY67_06075 [Candidatus Thermoplasmatota archaeon]|nr:hypothetical protein [Candidatus Thermoplasmatota archaeon]
MRKMIIVCCLVLISSAVLIPSVTSLVQNDTTPPEITIENPVEGYFHFSGIKLFETPLDIIGNTLGLGGFRVRPVQATITDDVDEPEDLTVELFADDVKERSMMYNSENGLFEGKWIGPALGTFTMKIVASDSSGNSAEETMTVWYFCFVPEP